MTLNSPGGSTLQCGTWLWNNMPLNIIIRPNVRHIGILLPVSISTISPQSSCHSAAVCEVLSKSYRQRQKNDVISIFKIADLRLPIGRHYGPSLNCLVFEKIAFMHFGDRQTNKQTDKQMDRPIALSRSRCRERRLNTTTTATTTTTTTNNNNNKSSATT